MKNLLYIIGFVFSAMLLFSCEPNRDENGDLLFGVVPPKEEPSVSPKYLTQVTKFDGQDATTVTYTYNSDNKLTNVAYTDSADANFRLTYNAEGEISQVDIRRFQNGTLVNTSLKIEHAGTNVTATGEAKMGDSVLYNTRTTFQSVEKATKIITSRETRNSEGGTDIPVLRQESTISYTGNNVAKWELKTTAYPSTGETSSTSVVSYTSYDQHKNPFADLPLVFNLISLHFGAGEEAISGMSNNNVKVVAGKTYEYKYNDKNYPVKATIANTTQSVTFEYQQ